uniref:Uncharacterized protein n=1 Tax=Romanomermis culicivorax TaxID=13658 RepID=A0A915I1F9_ROMCU
MIDAAVGSIHSLTVDQEIDFDNLEMVKKSDHKMRPKFRLCITIATITLEPLSPYSHHITTAAISL